MKVEFVNLKRNINDNYKGGCQSILEPKIKDFLFNNCYYVNGPQVNEFEQNFANYIGTKYCLGVNSGTDALKLSIKMLELGKDDEILVQGNTFIGSVSGASELGCKLKILDIDPTTYMVDTNKIEENITKKTKAIIIVHLFGSCPDMDYIIQIAKKYNLFVIEDTAQAHGAYYKDQRLGSIGDVGCFSFYPSKNLGAMGDAGAITTNHQELYDKIKIWRNWGAEKKYYHKYTGGNSRLDTIQAIILNEKLKFLDEKNNMRCHNAKMYIDLLKDIPNIILPSYYSFCKPVWHLFVIQLENKNIRDKLQEFLNSNEIQTGIHYPIPIHKLEAYPELLDQEENLPHVTSIASRILSLPIYPELEQEEIKYICSKIHNFF
jgi:dTDP-4-amino-4,6-dideoxygalactose transaminase